jgi:DNA-binding HxlR family transcriptional regulator
VTEQLGGARFAAYRGHLEISRDMLVSTLAYLMDLGLLERNTGYGHPLRPEYVATQRGKSLGPACAELYDCMKLLNVERIALRKWSLPVIGAIHGDLASFSLLHGHLSPITPRALSKCLAELAVAGLITRAANTTNYSLTAAADRLIPSLISVCRIFNAG